MEEAKRLSIAEALRREGLGANLVDVAEILWSVASLEPGHRAVITVADLGHRLRKDARCVRRWLADLAAEGLIRIESREKRWGAYTFTMADPRVRLRTHIERAVDEQQALFDPPSPATVSFADHAPQVVRSADMVSALDAQRGHGVRATGPEPTRSADNLSALGGERTADVLARSDAQLAEYRSVVAEARAAIDDSARGVHRVCAGAKGKGIEGNMSLEGSGKRQRLEPSNLPTRETGPPPPATLAGAFGAALAAIPTAGDTATQRAAVAAELAAALGVGEALKPGFWSNVAALVGEPGPDGRVQYTRAVVDAILARAWAKQPHDAVLRAQYASKALRSQARHVGLEWPRAP